MFRVFVFNNYPFEDVWEEVKRKEKPDHHLYGINYFSTRGYEVHIVPFINSVLLQRVNTQIKNFHLPIPVGDLDQQWSFLKQLTKADIIYAPCQTQTHLLHYLRSICLLNVPIVCLAHHPLQKGRLAWLRKPFVQQFVKGADAFPSLSKGVAEEINTIAQQHDKSWKITWGPDANYYPCSANVGQGVVAAGRTGRDFDTFGLAASQTNSDAIIVCLQNSVSLKFCEFGRNVQILVQPNNDYMKYPELLKICTEARVLAIPMHSTSSLAGLTSLVDALGLGKPVIMTKHPLIDLDIEREGIGIWVKAGDVNGWQEAIQFFEDNPAEAVKMGQRARKLVAGDLNSKAFADQIMDIFDRLLERA